MDKFPAAIELWNTGIIFLPPCLTFFVKAIWQISTHLTPPSSMRNVFSIAVSGLCLLLCSNSFAEHYQLFLLTGQSNSLGVTNGGEANWSIGDDPADANVPFFWKNVANATTTLGDSGGEFVSLRETQGGFYAGSKTHWGPEISFARTLYRAGMRHFGIIKVSRGGGGNGLWSKADRGHMYQLVVDTVGRAADALTNDGHTFKIIGLMYLQGESDSRAEAAIADTRFSQLLDNLRADLPSAESIQGFIGGVAAAGGNRDLVRAKQAALAARDARVHYFDNLDQQPRLHDSLHFNKAAKITVGERYAEAIMRAGLYLPSYGKLVFVGDSITVPKSSVQRSYTLFESADLGIEDPWRQVGVPITGNDDTLKFLHTRTKEKGFFRVEVSSHEQP
ncbi:MAG: sialate O-acetylesterase [Akkermansiaceae bacterium]|nr:sialate O-acetylesterase [Akkermansiaceae bacterium]